MVAPAYLGMSDEDFLKTMPPDAPEVEPPKEVEPPQLEEPVVVDPASSDPDQVGEAPVVVETEEPKVVEEVIDPKTTGVDHLKEIETSVPKPGSKDGEPAPKDVDKGADKPQDKTQEKPALTTAPDYEGFYKRIMAPFKANGKMVELKTPEEALQLMQMGANYTKKMQDIVPHRKALLMLENNGLLDEAKLSYLIDLDKKNPEAIKKLIKEAGIDPLEIDTSTEPVYHAGNHRVTDEEATFRTALDDMKSNQSGLETLQAINTDWDQVSKELLWKSPEVMQIIHQQRESGIYDRIAAEMNRQKTLGVLAPATPFLQAYKTVGDQLVQANAFADLGPTGTGSGQGTAPAVVTTRVAAPKPAVVNNDKAKAASSTRTSAQTQKGFVNPLSLSDDEFLKQMHNRI